MFADVTKLMSELTEQLNCIKLFIGYAKEKVESVCETKVNVVGRRWVAPNVEIDTRREIMEVVCLFRLIARFLRKDEGSEDDVEMRKDEGRERFGAK